MKQFETHKPTWIDNRWAIIRNINIFVLMISIIVLLICILFNYRQIKPKPIKQIEEIKEVLLPYERQMIKIDDKVKKKIAFGKEIKTDKYIHLGMRPFNCLLYKFEKNNMIWSQFDRIDLFAYDLNNNGKADILKWDFGQDKQVDIIEYDTDEDGEYEYAKADMNCNRHFDDKEIYSRSHGNEGLLFPGALPFPSLPVFPY